MIDERNREEQVNLPANLFLYDGNRVELSGIADVTSFTDTSVIAVCKYGEMSIDGENLHIESFDAASGALSVTGSITGFFYYDKVIKEKKKRKLFSK